MAVGRGGGARRGSGGTGATNVGRLLGRGGYFTVMVIDVTKGALIGAAARHLGLSAAWAFAAAWTVVAGHVWPVWLGFRGGKGVATGLGVLLALAFPVGAACCLIWLAMAFWRKISSLAALTAFAAAPLLALLAGRGHAALVALAIAALVVFKHRANIARLRAGTEPRIRLSA
ncbi:MAG: glycerol-3-phosphate acyltransferase [Rhodospirillales bacterium]|nr:glycerol-3-phosphate acyltransferase [Rhodospirillales bacterium]